VTGLRRARRRSRIRPYPAQYPRSIDPVDKLGLQDALGAGELEAYYLRGEVSYQTAKLPSDIRDLGTLGESRIIIRPISRNQVEYEFGSLEPSDSIIKSQGEILKDITEGFGLERAEEALGVSIKERLILHEVSKLPKELQDQESIQGTNDLYHYETAAGDFTGVVSRSLRLPSGFLRSPPRYIRNELIEHEIVKANEPVLGKIRSALRTEWIIPEAKGWGGLLDIMHPLHAELTKPCWWQDVAVPTSVIIQDGAITPLNAQMYQLLRRKYFVALQLPERIM
jgi:hypothetical protein